MEENNFVLEIEKKDDNAKIEFGPDGSMSVITDLDILPAEYEFIEDDTIHRLPEAVNIMSRIFLFNSFLVFVIYIVASNVYLLSSSITDQSMRAFAWVVAGMMLLMYFLMALTRMKIVIYIWAIALAGAVGLFSRIFKNGMLPQLLVILYMQSLCAAVFLIFTATKKIAWTRVVLASLVGGCLTWVVGIYGYVLQNDWVMAGGGLGLSIVFAVYTGLQSKYTDRYTGIANDEMYSGLINFYTDPICFPFQCCKK